MSYYDMEQVKKVLDLHPELREKLYCRGFLITDHLNLDIYEYPFYGYWKKHEIQMATKPSVFFYTHDLTPIYFYNQNGITYFIIGHAYNPYTMEHKEEDILKSLSIALMHGQMEYWDKESELTGVFCIGYIKDDILTYSTDCTGMQLIYYGNSSSNFYITSHSKLVADLCGFQQDDYIVRLVNSRFYKYWGTFLPGELSPFRELKRTQPNFAFSYNFVSKAFSYKRYFPTHKIVGVPEEQYEDVLAEIADRLQNNLRLVSMKWPKERAAISVTGGRDSTTTLASANHIYGDLGYFSYISNEAERVDAEAAHNICNYLGLSHKTYVIPEESELYENIDIIKMILECNAGCIGHNNLNDVKKRIYLDTIHDFDVEIKSWVDELSRAEAQNKYNMKKFPQSPTPGYFRCMWKVIANPRLIAESNQVFRDYLRKFYSKEIFSFLPWMDYFYWEFSWSAGEGMFLTSEHKYSDDITIPYNNRKLLNTMLSVPFEKRLNSQIQIDVIRLLDRRIEDSKVHVKDVAHTDLWSTIIRIYLKIFSKFNF